MAALAPEIGPKNEFKFTVVYYRDEIDDFYVAECLELPGCMSQGKTEEEAEANIKNAIESCVAVIIEGAIERAQSRQAPAAIPPGTLKTISLQIPCAV